ncbi:MAG: thiamine-phosphate kinase [Candidatus Thorarchaeota archaeon]
MVRLSDLGEVAIIKLLQDYVNDGLLGKNEDAVAVSVSADLAMVANIDGLSWKDDVIPQMNDEQVGKKLVSATISDLAAKGCSPSLFLSSLNFPPNWDSSQLIGVAKGISQATADYGILYLGGDLGSALDSPVLVGVAVGFCKPDQLMSRAKIKPGDPIYSTGAFGFTGLGFAHLFADLDLPHELRERALEKILEPRARVREGLQLAQTSAVTGSIDSSDGLAMSLHWLAETSGIGIDVEKLPIDPLISEFAASQNLDPFEWVMYGGEEFELIVALNQQENSHVYEALRKANVELIKIGHATETTGEINFISGGTRPVERRGWDSHRGFI